MLQKHFNLLNFLINSCIDIEMVDTNHYVVANKKQFNTKN